MYVIRRKEEERSCCEWPVYVFYNTVRITLETVLRMRRRAGMNAATIAHSAEAMQIWMVNTQGNTN